MPQCIHARQEMATRPPARTIFLRREAPGHMQSAHQRKACSNPPSGPCCSQPCWRAGAPAAQQPRRNSIGCQTCKAVRKRASRGHLHTRNAGGWAVDGGRFALTQRLGLMFYATSRPARAQKRDPLARPRRLAERQEVHSARGGRQKGAVGRGLGWVGVPESVEMQRSGRVRIVPVVRGRARVRRGAIFHLPCRGLFSLAIAAASRSLGDFAL